MLRTEAERAAVRARGRKLTMAEIERRCDGDWVLLVDPVVRDESLAIDSAKLIFHHKSRAAVYRVALRRRDRHTAIFWVGKPRDLTYL